jgi:hypothetical protein
MNGNSGTGISNQQAVRPRGERVMMATESTERLRVSFEVDKADLEEARRIMTKLTKDEDPTIQLPLTDEQVAFTLYLNGVDNYFESYGEDESD